MTRREIIKYGGLALTGLTMPLSITNFTKYIYMETTNFDVIIIGGSYAGLSAAMALGRSLRSVLIIDSGFPCNNQTPHSHNFITQDGEKPAIIAEKAKVQVLKYDTVKAITDYVIDANKTANGYAISTQNGAIYNAKKIIFATGVKDIMPEIKGFAECWGISVIHCPYCHGYEVKKQKTGILANGDAANHYAQLLQNLTKDLTIFTNRKAAFTKEQLDKFKKHKIEIIEKEIAYLKHEKGNVKEIVFQDATSFQLQAIYSRPKFEQHCKIPETLGCELTEQGHIKVDLMQKTSVTNVFACGDNSSSMRSVANAVATGNITGAAINYEFTQLEF